MDNPGTSLFQGGDININNSQNHEEEEDLEDQIRRREELQNLLTVALDDFNYDESTINSSTNVSVVSIGDNQHFREAQTPTDQLRVLYDVRVREINNLKEEYSNYKSEKSKEIDGFNRRLILAEADNRQLKDSYKNAEILLVDKTNIINNLKRKLDEKDAQIGNHGKIIEQYEIEISAYKSSVNELQMKLQAENNPFHLGGRQFKSEEQQRAHQDQILKLESQLEQQTQKADVMEKEAIKLQRELATVIDEKMNFESETNVNMKALMKTFEGSQQQCKELLEIVEMLGRENVHYRERMKAYELGGLSVPNDNTKPNASNVDVLVEQCEKLKRMLADKSFEISSLQSKLKNFEANMHELYEYRQYKADICNADFKECDNKLHTKDFILMQSEMKNFPKMLQAKDDQITNLTTINKELQEKIEEMLLQTRNDIQNLSHKYSLPQLEIMSQDLKEAEEKIQELEENLYKAEQNNSKLLKQLQTEAELFNSSKQSNSKEVTLRHQLEKAQHQILTQQKLSETEKQNFEELMKMIQKDLKQSQDEVLKLRQKIQELKEDHSKIPVEAKIEEKTIKSEYEQLKEQLNLVMNHIKVNKPETQNVEIYSSLKAEMDYFIQQLQNNDIEKHVIEQNLIQWRKQINELTKFTESESNKILNLELEETRTKLKEIEIELKSTQEMLEDLNSCKTLLEGEKYSMEYKLKDCEINLDEAVKKVQKLERKDNSDLVALKTEIKHLQSEIMKKDKFIKMCEEDKMDLNKLMVEMKNQLEAAKLEILKIHADSSEAKEKKIRRNLEKELQDAEMILEQSRIEERNELDPDALKNIMEAKFLKNEIKLREEIHKEYARKIRDIEEKYKNICIKSTELYKQELDKMKKLEQRYREQFSQVLAECAEKMKELEQHNAELESSLHVISKEYDAFRKESEKRQENMNKSIEKIEKEASKIECEADKKVEAWKKWAKDFVSKSMTIESVNKKSRDKIISGIKKTDKQIEAIEKEYVSKMKKYIKTDLLKQV